MRNLLIIFVISSLLQACVGQNPKINGVSFVASGDSTSQKHVQPVLDINANYAAVMPFGFTGRNNRSEIRFNTPRQWFGEREEGVRQYVSMLHKNNIKVMLKPQIWIQHGTYTGHLKMETEEEWKTFEKSYSEFILLFAKIAQDTKVDMFCIGTELEQFIEHRPEYWFELIAQIKKVYKGKLTYAANWDEYKRVPFWKELDFIGVDAYFPVSNMQTPTLVDAKKGWQPWIEEMKGVSTTYNRPILFTEYGYRSVDFAGKEPWNSDRNITGVNLEAQKTLMRSLFEELYPNDWFAGGFIWKWFVEHDKVGGSENNQFTPQNKPVENTIKEQFKQ